MIVSSRSRGWRLGVAAVWVASAVLPSLAGLHRAAEHERLHVVEPEHVHADAHTHGGSGHRHPHHAPAPPPVSDGLELATHGHEHPEGTPAHDHPGVASRTTVRVAPGLVAVAGHPTSLAPLVSGVAPPVDRHRRGPPAPLFLASHALLL